MKAKRFLLLVVAICLASGVEAQFYDSEQVYCYEYQYTFNNDVKKDEDNPNPWIEFVLFKNGCMGEFRTTKNDIREKGETSYFEESVRKDFLSRYNKFNASSPAYGIPPSMFVYDSSLSKGSTYTYRDQQHNTRQLRYDSWLGIVYGWNGTSWKTKCYSFSTDKKEMIEWWTDSHWKNYYKLVDANAYKPNTDFLW